MRSKKSLYHNLRLNFEVLLKNYRCAEEGKREELEEEMYKVLKKMISIIVMKTYGFFAGYKEVVEMAAADLVMRVRGGAEEISLAFMKQFVKAYVPTGYYYNNYVLGRKNGNTEAIGHEHEHEDEVVENSLDNIGSWDMHYRDIENNLDLKSVIGSYMSMVDGIDGIDRNILLSRLFVTDVSLSEFGLLYLEAIYCNALRRLREIQGTPVKKEDN